MSLLVHTPKGIVQKELEGRSGHLQGSDSSHVVDESGDRAGDEGAVRIPDDDVVPLVALPCHWHHIAVVA